MVWAASESQSVAVVKQYNANLVAKLKTHQKNKRMAKNEMKLLLDRWLAQQERRKESFAFLNSFNY